MGKLLVRINSARCTGSARCTELAPHVFHMNEEGNRSVVDQPEQPDNLLLRQAAEECPWQAIILTDAATGKQVFP